MPTLQQHDDSDNDKSQNEIFVDLFKASLKDFLKTGKIWLHTIGAIFVAHLITVAAAGIGMYIDVQLMKRQQEDQIKTNEKIAQTIKEVNSELSSAINKLRETAFEYRK